MRPPARVLLVAAIIVVLLLAYAVGMTVVLIPTAP